MHNTSEAAHDLMLYSKMEVCSDTTLAVHPTIIRHRVAHGYAQLTVATDLWDSGDKVLTR